MVRRDFDAAKPDLIYFDSCQKILENFDCDLT